MQRPTVNVVALLPHKYAQKKRAPGDVYEARLSDLKFLERSKWAKKAPEPAPAPAAPGRRYKRRDLEATE
jgi:hypothetical protein